MEEDSTSIWYADYLSFIIIIIIIVYSQGIVLSEKDEQTLETFTKYRLSHIIITIIIIITLIIVIVRYNTQRDDNFSVDRGPHQQIPIEQYQPGIIVNICTLLSSIIIIIIIVIIIVIIIAIGLFNVSGYRPMLPSTRALLGIRFTKPIIDNILLILSLLLDKCWKDDCNKINKYTNYNYSCYKANN
jgi:hypothetical protein